MKKYWLIFACIICFASCKKNITTANNTITSSQLYPLSPGNKWIYIDSFFDFDGDYYGFDTFYLKSADSIIHNNVVYTPITDDYDEPIFTVRSDDTSAFILEPAGEALMFSWPLPTDQSYLSNSYSGDTLTSKIYTHTITTTNYPSYKILITQEDGLWNDYKQEEFYFTVGIGIIKGYTRWKNSNGDLFTSDSYVLISHSNR